MDANPLDNLNYKWHFNNSLESLIELPSTVGSVGSGAGVAMGLTSSLSSTMGGGGGHRSQQPMLLHADASHASAGYYQRSKRKHLHGQQQHEGKQAHGRHGRMAMRTIVHGQQQQQQVMPHMETWSNIQFEDDDFEMEQQRQKQHHYRQHYRDGTTHGLGIHDADDDDNHHHYDDDDDVDGTAVGDDSETDETINGVYGRRSNSEDLPYTQMVYSNMIYKNHLDSKQHSTGAVGGSSIINSGKQSTQYQPQHHQQQQMRSQPLHEAATHSNQYQQLAERKRLAALHKQQHHRLTMTTTTTTASPVPLNNVYTYHIESYESFGAISCVASSPMGQSQPCWYHVQPAGKYLCMHTYKLFEANSTSMIGWIDGWYKILLGELKLCSL